MPRRSRGSKRKSSSESIVEDDEADSTSERLSQFNFSQQAPELSQSILPVKPSEQRNLQNLTPEAREKLLLDLSRLLLFKALAGDPIDRLKAVKEAGITSDHGKLSTAAFSEATKRLEDVFGFSLKRIPMWMENQKSLAKRFKDRYYVVNAVADDAAGQHSKAIHSVHLDSAIEKGFLMIVLSFVFCKGEARSDKSRWILDVDLYALLHMLDENIPEEPPAPGTSRARNATLSQADIDGVALTPDVDRLLQLFVTLDYLIKEKVSEDFLASTQRNIDENSFVYAMGPRAAIEIGRKQIIFFCAEILDEEPDPTMLRDLEEDEDEAFEDP